MTSVQAYERLTSFADLKEGWDSYSGKPISPEAIDWAKILLVRLGPGWIPIPCSDGGVQLEFHEQGIDIEIGIQKSGKGKA